MPDALLRRGCVVARGRRYGVVWAVLKGQLELIPILDPHHAWAHDVELSEEERIACGVPIRNAVIRAAVRSLAAPQDHRLAGTLPPAVACRLCQAVIRAHVDIGVRERWACDREHRERAHVPGAVTSRNADRVTRVG